ncbi:MAG: hypothetical protein IT374_24075 [Polyangiaceae bacterium]|nr:hypothetical protein [Polyangiaceae bacterium]
MPSVPDLKAYLARSGFEIYRTKNGEISLAERPRPNLIMDSGVTVIAGDSIKVRVVVRVERREFPGEDDERLFERARALWASAVSRGWVEVAHASREVRDTGDGRQLLDTWFEVTYEHDAADEAEAAEEARFAVGAPKIATHGA